MDYRRSTQTLARHKRWILVVVQILAVLLVVVFAGLQLSDAIRSISLSNTLSIAPYLAMATLLYVVFYIILSYHWVLVCGMLEPDSRRQWLSFFASQPYKYLPTSLFTFSFRAKYAKQLGLSYRKSSQAQLIENLSMIGTALMIATVIWLWLHGYVALAAVSAVMIMACLVVGVLILRKILKIQNEVSVIRAAGVLCVSLSAWLVAGLGLSVLVSGIDGVGLFEETAGVIAANAGAFGLGILAFFAPGGLGVRELVFQAFGIVAIAIVYWRLVTLVVDLSLGPLAWYLASRAKIKN